MHVAKPEELTSYALPVLTAQVSDAELAEWFPVPFEEIENPDATPEPSRGALLRLSTGELFVIYFGRVSKQLTLRLPPTSHESAVVESFLREVPLPLSRVIWHRPDVELPHNRAVADNDGTITYSPAHASTSLPTREYRWLFDYARSLPILDFHQVGQVVVIKKSPGSVVVPSPAVSNSRFAGLLGIIVGVDTVFAAFETEATASDFAYLLRSLSRKQDDEKNSKLA